MPHINIKFFPVALNRETEQQMIDELTEAVTAAFGCSRDVVSIALEPVEEQRWQSQVYQPEIVERRHLLRKLPNY
jgi:4-oxalocrotonate tautomerase